MLGIIRCQDAIEGGPEHPQEQCANHGDEVTHIAGFVKRARLCIFISEDC